MGALMATNDVRCIVTMANGTILSFFGDIDIDVNDGLLKVYDYARRQTMGTSGLVLVATAGTWTKVQVVPNG